MSLETDARDALIEAIRERNNVEVDPEDFDNVKPSDQDIGVKDGSAWKTTLDEAADLLRAKGYEVDDPTLEQATKLRPQVLLESSIYLETLAGTGGGNALAKAAAAAAVAGAVTYATVRLSARKKARRNSRPRKAGSR